MNTTNLKYLILFILVIFSQVLFSQENKFGLTVEYSPNLKRLTNTVVDKKFILGHNAVLRVSYKTEGIINPTIGIGFINTGEVESPDFTNQIYHGQFDIKYFHNYNYAYIPIGAKINFSNIYLLPEVGIAVSISYKTKEVTESLIGSPGKETRDVSHYSEEINALTFPVSLSIGTDFNLGNNLFSTGIKGYYGLNQVVKDLPGNNHYFGLGLVLAMNL